MWRIPDLNLKFGQGSVPTSYEVSGFGDDFGSIVSGVSYLTGQCASDECNFKIYSYDRF